MSYLGARGVSNDTSIRNTMLNHTMDDMTQRIPIEDLLSDSGEEEDDPFNSVS